MKAMSRRSFVSNIAAGVSALSAAELLGGASPRAEAQLVYTTQDWKLAEFDKIVHARAHVKQAFDATGIEEGKFLNNITNSLNGLHFGFGIPNEQILIVGALHGAANLLNYDDFIWNKYKIGEWLKVEDPTTGKPAIRNPFYPARGGAQLHYASTDPNSEDSIFQDRNMQALQHRGVRFLSCHTATEEQARALKKRLNLTDSREQIATEMLAHLVPGSLVVASMVAALALLQVEGRFSYTKV